METPTEDLATLEQAQELGLLPEEFEKIKEILGRTPNFTELSVYSVMWSEHCSYKNSIKWLKTLPKEGPQMLAKAGEENAGVVDIGDGLGCAFKIESHNHPSAIEPYQGAATGVGGINRDIFTMGARPVAQLNSLRFGELDRKHTQWIMKGVVKGIGDYGNSFGVPVVGGEVYFDKSYNTNPLVNAMSVGILDTDRIIRASSEGVGNPVYIVGSSTGKDGIHGAAFASKDMTAESAEDLPSVQVGDPFQEKLLLEATMELSKTDAVVGMQDMGAAGISCSTSEMSAVKGFGMDIDLDKVPLRQEDMQAFEILLSESQERMLVVAKKGKEEIVESIFEKWDLNAVQIGEVTEGGRIKFRYRGEMVADMPAESLVLGGGAPVYDREYSEPAYYQRYKKFNLDEVEEPTDIKTAAFKLLARPNIASKRWVIEQYDSMVGTANMGTNRPSDAGIVNIKGTDRALALTVDCNARYVQADPEVGTAIAVAESARNITCAGGTPLAVTNCLNFGNPYNPEVYWQFVGAIKGMSRSCERLGTPVTGGNVSFYNQTNKEGADSIPVFPTPTIGMVGLLEHKSYLTSLDFKSKGHLIYLLGESRDDLGSSEYLAGVLGIEESPAPYFDLESEVEVQGAVKSLIREKLISAAHDVSDGGLFVSIVEMGLPRGLGFDITSDGEVRTDSFLFGESQSRVIVTVDPNVEDEFIEHMSQESVPFTLLGHVTRGKMVVDDLHLGFIQDAKDVYEGAIEKYLNKNSK